MMNKKLQIIVKQITKWAREHENIVSYTMILDILKEECKSVEHEELEHITYQLAADGIQIEPFEEDETYEADLEEPEKFIPADVSISQNSINVYNLMERLRYHEINLQPGFQRKGGLWTYEQQSKLIESLMLKIPLPAFYFDASKEDQWIVIDGLQRLTAFLNYLVGVKNEEGVRVKRKFEKLQYLSEFNGLDFDELPRQYVRRIKEASIIAYTVERGTPDEVVFNIFQRINTGGLSLSDQEIRQALYGGKATKLIEKLAKSLEFLEATQYQIKSERMLDREYVTRYLAFTELDYEAEYKGNIDNFLIKGLKHVNTYTKDELKEIEKNFKRVMSYTHMIFGKYAFRKYNKDWRRGPINKALFELWSVCFCDMQDEDLDKLVDRKQEFLEKFQKLLQNRAFINALKAGDPYSCKRRIRMTRKIIREFI